MTHPNLVSYYELDKSERALDLTTASDALKIMLL